MPAGSKPQGDGLAIIFSAPSGAGKTTLVRHLMTKMELSLGFSVSATTRGPREGEVNGKDYHFLPPEDFAEKVKNGAFVEYEEVYEGLSYGTLCSEVEKLWRDGRTPLFDVDVVGGQTLKAVFGDSALSIFVMPPSLFALEDRLRGRGTEDEAAL
ncbi:MAG TPA: guanylate kinase, partial [Flavobacteriales bacterium]|nr:guanylate kinase [Flavobacteriales bacterium]